tara:strand:- start:288 stop:1127 length:840 start_codon:yes stop_codon:yes gene_type:complete
MSKVYIVGNGYIGDFLSNGFKDKYHFVGVCRSTKSNCNINISLDISKNKEALHSLIEPDGIIVYLASPQKKGLVDTTLSNFLTAIEKRNVKKIIYISTSGVYGDKKDRTVNEMAKLEPLTDRAVRRVDAENQIKYSFIKHTILRVPGIYGANRLPIQRIKERMPLIKRDICKHTNLIHAKDLSSIIENCISNEKTNNITMNVSDGTPIKTTDYYLKIYDALKIDYPEFIDYEIANKIYDEKRKSFINESRILDVSRLNEIMPDIIRFKDVTEGIEDCLQ